MLLLIGGHPRSGTTLLRNLCDRHPDMAITNEFGNFMKTSMSWSRYGLYIFRRCMAVKGRWAFNSADNNKSGMQLRNLLFSLNYLGKLYGQTNLRPVGSRAMESTLNQIFPGTRVVGDKWPAYVYNLGRFLKHYDNVRILIVYRDCRDVVSSTLRMGRTVWQNMEFLKRMDTAEKVAARWVQAIETMERHREYLHIIKYEQMVENPAKTFSDVSVWLGVDNSGFIHKEVKKDNVGKYKTGLTDEEYEDVIRIAGDTMNRLGYS
jgi:hypothetical protein